MKKLSALLKIGLALAFTSIAAQGATGPSVVRAMVKRALEVAGSNFAGIRGAITLNKDGYTDYDLTPDFLALTTGSALRFPGLKVEHYAGGELDWWQLSIGFTTSLDRDAVPSFVQKILGPVIPASFSFTGVEYDEHEPDTVKFRWKGPNDVFINVKSFVLSKDYPRDVAIDIERDIKPDPAW